MTVAVTKQKQVMAKSRALYRGVIIFETKNGFEFFIGFRKYQKSTLLEATAFIDEKLGGNRV